MHDIIEKMRGMLAAAIDRDLELEFIGRDVDLSARDLFMPHLHHGLEIKLRGVTMENSPPDHVAHWSKARAVVIPARIIHSSEPSAFLTSILIENSKIICVCNSQMLPVAVPVAVMTDMGIAASSLAGFLNSCSTCETPSAQTVNHCVLLLKSLFSALNIALENLSQGKTGTLSARAADYINRNYYRHNLSVGDVAAHLGVTPNYLVMRFNRETGATIRQYLIQTRMEHARLLLQSGCYMVKDAARLTGWNSAYYFSNSFHKHFGIPPKIPRIQ